MASSPVPLARLFAIAFRSLLARVHARLAELGHHDVGSSFGYVLLAARERALTGNEIALLMGMTKQAASKLVDQMVQAGYLERRPHPDDARAKLLRMTPKGTRLLAQVERIYQELESEWAEAIGARELARMRNDLTAALKAMHGGELPAVRPIA